MTKEELEKAIQEFEDNAFHHSLHPEISASSLAIAWTAMVEMLNS